MKLPNPQYTLGQVVYPKLAAEKGNGLVVTGYLIRGSGLSYLALDSEGEEKEWPDFTLVGEPVYGATEES